MAGFTTKTKFDYERPDTIWDWVNNCGQGLMGYDYGDIPDACFQFCLDQYSRFNVPMNDELAEVISTGASASFYYLDVFNPYALFEGVSDVNLTDDWSRVTYRIFSPRNPDRKSYEPDPEHVESFAVAPGQAEEIFTRHLAMPGLRALPGFHGHEIEDLLSEGTCGEPPYDTLSVHGRDALDRVCLYETAPGEYALDTARINAYFELAAWAAYLWLVGPLGRSFRMARHDIVTEAMEHGECILVDGTIISPRYYTKEDRPPQSCYKCGVQVWCVEPTQVLAHTGLICEACLNFDMPKFRNANCGSKFCTFSLCPNHPYHRFGSAGAVKARREHGQLAGIATGAALHQVMGQAPNMRRLGF